VRRGEAASHLPRRIDHADRATAPALRPDLRPACRAFDCTPDFVERTVERARLQQDRPGSEIAHAIPTVDRFAGRRV